MTRNPTATLAPPAPNKMQAWLAACVWSFLLLGVVTLSGKEASRAAIPIGKARQLFIDNHVIDSMEALRRTLHGPEKHPGNPIMTGDMPWEENHVTVHGRPVLYDAEERIFKMWYSRGGSWPSDYTGRRSNRDTFYTPGYATSRDGIHWERPELGLFTWEGSSKNNLIPPGETWIRRPCVIKEPGDPDPERRYKMMHADVVGGRLVTAMAFSPDGIRWRTNVGDPIYPRYNEQLLGWDPRIRQYVFFGADAGPKGTPENAGIGRMTSTDFLNWSPLQVVMLPEADEPRCKFTGLTAVLYEEVYVASLWISGRGRNDAELAFSRDGIKWSRPFRGQPWLPVGPSGSWDDHTVRPVAPVIWQDRLWFYYGGGNRAEQQKGKPGFGEAHAIGLATLPLDRFVSLDAESAGATMTTKLLRAPSGRLRVNATIHGELRVEVLGSDGKPLAGYTATECEPLRSDAPDHPVRWKRHRDLAGLAGKDLRLRFHAREAQLYSFWVE